MLKNALWIWANTQKANQRVHFFFDTEIEMLPKNAVLHISCETVYWLYVNGELTVYEGGQDVYDYLIAIE